MDETTSGQPAPHWQAETGRADLRAAHAPQQRQHGAGSPVRHVQALDGQWRAAVVVDPAACGEAAPDCAELDSFEARVPAALQHELVRLGRLDPPFASMKAAAAAAWVSESDWALWRRFDWVVQAHEGDRVVLEVDGIDTFSEIWLNQTRIGATANAYRSYRFDVEPALLRPQGNEILVHVKAHKRAVAPMVDEARKRLGETFRYKGLIRRYQRTFLSGSAYLNLKDSEILGIGIHRSMRLAVVPAMTIEDVHFSTLSVSDERAEAKVEAALSMAPPAGALFRARLVEPESGAVAARAETEAFGAQVDTALTIVRPRLWWPRGYGQPHRYRLEVELVDGDHVLARSRTMVGVKTCELVERAAEGRPTFIFRINGVDVFVRGHNVVPTDHIAVHGSPESYRWLLRLVCDSGSNMVRLWGGGAPEPSDFFEACDALGLMVWQDFYLHSTTYPDYEESWVENYRAECAELVKRLRNHPSLTLICGGNEQCQGWDEWGWRGHIDQFFGRNLIETVGREVAQALAPELPYIVNSPYGGVSCQSPAEGDMHNWGNFHNATKDPLFVSETCWSQQSYSRLATLATEMGLNPEQFRGPGWPARWTELTGLDLVTRPAYGGGVMGMQSLEHYLRDLEIEQALADDQGLSSLLLRSPSCNGLLYWPLNKGAPLFQFGCVDYHGWPLASYYVVKRLFADAVINIYRDIDQVRVVGVNRAMTALQGRLRVVHQRLDGKILWENWLDIHIPAQGRARLDEIDALYGQVRDRTQEMAKAQLWIDDRLVSEDTLLFCPLNECRHADSAIKAVAMRLQDGRVRLTLRSDVVVPMICAEAERRFVATDNYFCLAPDTPRSIDIEWADPADPATELSIEAIGSGAGQTVTIR